MVVPAPRARRAARGPAGGRRRPGTSPGRRCAGSAKCSRSICTSATSSRRSSRVCWPGQVLLHLAREEVQGHAELAARGGAEADACRAGGRGAACRCRPRTCRRRRRTPTGRLRRTRSGGRRRGALSMNSSSGRQAALGEVARWCSSLAADEHDVAAEEVQVRVAVVGPQVHLALDDGVHGEAGHRREREAERAAHGRVREPRRRGPALVPADRSTRPRCETIAYVSGTFQHGFAHVSAIYWSA